MPAREPFTIFIVDDDPGVLRLISRALAREGFTVETAESGRAAAAWLKSNRADLMLLDLKLQDTTAIRLIDDLEAEGRSVPFVIITGQGDERVAVEMMRSGALDYLVKDAQFIEFVPAVVRHALAQIEKDRRLAAAEKQARLAQTIVEQAYSAVLVTDRTQPEPRITYVNPAFAALADCDAQWLEGRPLSEIEAVVGQIEPFRTALSNGKPFLGETRIVSRNEGLRIVDCNVTPVLDQTGEQSHWAIILRDITDWKESERRQKVQFEISAVLAEGGSFSATAEKILRVVGEAFNWQTGELWSVDPEANLLRHVRSWHSESASAPWVRATAGLTFEPGRGIPGRVWSSRTPEFIPNLPEDTTLPRLMAAEAAGLESAFAFPILLRQEVLGVMAFFGRRSGPPGTELLACFATIGSQIGQFIERKKLERELIEISEREQQRIGRDLHDGLGQQLTALEFFSVNLADDVRTQAPALVKPIKQMGEQLREAIRQTRAMASGLSPVLLQGAGLSSALRKLAENTSSMARVKCVFRSDSPVEIPDTPTATHLYRIAQEAVNNALKHGRAGAIRVSLNEKKGYIELVIADDGTGFNPGSGSESGMGLRVMKYRADLIGAAFRIQSFLGKGTRVECSLRKSE